MVLNLSEDQLELVREICLIGMTEAREKTALLSDAGKRLTIADVEEWKKTRYNAKHLVPGGQENLLYSQREKRRLIRKAVGARLSLSAEQLAALDEQENEITNSEGGDDNFGFTALRFPTGRF